MTTKYRGQESRHATLDSQWVDIYIKAAFGRTIYAGTKPSILSNWPSAFAKQKSNTGETNGRMLNSDNCLIIFPGSLPVTAHSTNV